MNELRSKAEALWVLSAQGKLASDKRFSMWKRQLNLFRDPGGIWRCGGRLHNAEFQYETKFPVLLIGNHQLTTLLIQQAHRRVLHNGVKETLTELRTRYWIIRGRAVVRQVLHRCNVCRRLETQSYHVPPPPPLPSFRVQEQPPFTYTGVDFAGPLFVKDGSKVWICLYTCCVTRAVHLDVVNNLSTESFLRSFKRFAARRGLRRKMVSDNGRTFKRAAKTLNTIMTSEEVISRMADARVEWTFNVERAPWWGGVFERMVQSMKRCLRKMMGRAKLSYEELSTIVVEVEAVLNSRSLSYISSGDIDEPLTPAHLLVGRRLISLPDHLHFEPKEDIDDEDFEITSDGLNKRMVFLNTMLQGFWKRWKQEYLQELRNIHQATRHPSGGCKEPKVGDVVVVHDDQERRGFWKLGRVKELLTGGDGEVRGALVKVHTSGRNKSLRRSIRHLYPLEVNSLASKDDSTTDDCSSSHEVVSNGDESYPTSTDKDATGSETSNQAVRPNCRPHRRAAVEARKRIKEVTMD